MRKWSDSISSLRDHGRNDLLAGFVVSLVALPLSLGLALASNVPPLAGLMAAIVGGVVMALMGGSNVTISGPGNSLVVVTLMAVASLGEGDLLAGYLFTLGAVVLSGALIFLAGALRFGGLSDFFPSSAVQGMLAAIGIIIMTKQIHIMLGEMNPGGSETIGHLINLPETFWEVATGKFGAWVVGTGLGSLAILIFYPKIRNTYVQAIPAPMWVVVISILISYIFEWNDVSHPIPPSYLVSVPEEPFNSLSFPDFSKWRDGVFWEAVFSLFLIATIESLLSIKGIDRLDPLQRRSNTNKDLRALGIANMVSGFLGGLNVVVVIARSSVNVTNGAKTRWSNFFHGSMIFLFLLLFRDLLVRIPLPALAAILVYTGWQLTRPEKFKKVYDVGWDQLLIFLVTLVTTLATNLIMGITTGILLTILLQLYLSRAPEIILRNLFKPNAMLLQEDDGTFLLSVKNFCNFLNFQSLKKRLETIPPRARVIIDFSLAEFVDYSVMEHLNGYKKSFIGKGGRLEIIGLDNLSTRSDHPLSAWYPSKSSRRDRHHEILTDRQRDLLSLFEDTEVLFQPGLMINPPELQRFGYFRTRPVDEIRNSLVTQLGRAKLTLMDVRYHEGEFISRENIQTTVAMLEFDHSVPDFTMHKENLLDRMGHLAGFQDIDFPNFPDFSKTYVLKGDHPDRVIQWFNSDLLNYLSSQPVYHIMGGDHALILFEKERLATVPEIQGLVSFATAMANLKLASEKIL